MTRMHKTVPTIVPHAAVVTNRNDFDRTFKYGFLSFFVSALENLLVIHKVLLRRFSLHNSKKS